MQGIRSINTYFTISNRSLQYKNKQTHKQKQNK